MEFTNCLRCMKKTERYPCSHCGYDPQKDKSQAYALRPGTILSGKYVVGTMLGQGGFGITYIGWDLALDNKIAIKEYFPSGQVGRDPASGTLQWYSTPQANAARNSGKDMFLKEARKMSRVREIPQVVHIRDLFQQNDTAYIVMDFVDGQTLKDYLAKTGPLNWEQAKAIFFPAIKGMEQVHKAGLIHRDLSPDNIMIMPDGSIKILDLGAAKDLNVNSGASSMQVAKGGFSPLEQYTQLGGSGTWTDVYSMAATMYYSITGVLPPPVMDRMEEDLIRWDLEPLKALPKSAVEAMKKAMAIFPKNRTQTIGEFLEQLDTHSTQDVLNSLFSKKLLRGKAPASGNAVKHQPPKSATVPEKPKKQPPKPAVPAEESKKKPPKATAPVIQPQKQASAVIPPVPEPKKQPPMVTAPVVEPKKEIPKATAPVTEPKKEAPKATAPVTDPKKEAPKATAPVTEPKKETPKATAPVTEPKKEAPKATAPVTKPKKETPKATAPVAKSQPKPSASGAAPVTKKKSPLPLVAGLAAVAAVVVICLLALPKKEPAATMESVATSSPTLPEATAPVETTPVETEPPVVLSITPQPISTGDSLTVALQENGTILTAGGQYNVASWQDISAVSAGLSHIVGLKANGTLVTAGDNSEKQCDVTDWRNIIAISTGCYHTVGLTADGTVVATGKDNAKQCRVTDWQDITAICAGRYHTVGLKADGTVVATGNNSFGQCRLDWNDIVAIGAGGAHTVGLKSDGTVVAAGNDVSKQCDVSLWRDIVAVSAGAYHTVGLKADGTVVAVGDNGSGQCNVSAWRDIVAICAGGNHTIGLKADGTVVTAGDNDNGQCNVGDWIQIRLPNS